MIKPTITEYLMNRLSDLGINEIFGVPGDYNFHIIEAVEKNPLIKWIGCCNELNSAYAADGYARKNGLGTLVTTYGVGELSAINGFAGACAENVPVLNITGLPKSDLFYSDKLIHHSLLNHEIFKEIYSKISACTVILNETNAQNETERALSIYYNYKKPVYVGIPVDVCKKPINITTNYFKTLESNKNNLNKAVSHIKKLIKKSEKPLVISDFIILRHNLTAKLQEFLEKTNINHSSTIMGKGSVNEESTSFIGIYCGDLSLKKTSEIVHNSDCIITFGLFSSDYNSGMFTFNIDNEKLIDIQFHYVKIGNMLYENVYITDLLDQLITEIEPKRENHYIFKTGYDEEDNEKLTQNDLFYEIQEFLENEDNFIAETGLSNFGAALIKLKSGISYFSQSFWGSIGWATPACMGICFVGKTNRTILLTGEGSHQIGFAEVSSIARYNLNPIIIVVNNSGYTIERMLCDNPCDKFNDIVQWDYTELAKCFSEKFVTFKVKTKRELSNALKKARTEKNPVYIEVFTEKLDCPDSVKKLAQLAKN